MVDWRELNLIRRPPVFNVAHRWMKVLAVCTGLPTTTVCLTAALGTLGIPVAVRLGLALVLALAVPSIVVRLISPKDDPLIAVGLPSETFALTLLGFAVIFVVVAHDRTAPLLIRESDRDAMEGATWLADAAWILTGVRSTPDGSPTALSSSLRR
jgi:hypothetical protein